MARKFWLGVGLLLLICIAIGIYWTNRLDIPNPKPWWYGKDVVVRMEVWEPGKDMATFAMTMPKKTLDTMYALGVKSEIDVDGRQIQLRSIWKDLQRLPKNEKLRFTEEGSILVMWIEERGEGGTPGPTDVPAGPRDGQAPVDTVGSGA
ncbi:MAG TPA: hypothetical protein VFP58_12295 [Candidatus Eisenbacteria bacterium]|nr:hypothetical protein [Candidatus Eisenbacteria bacterium]